MRELARGKRVRVVALAALVVALAAGVTLGATLRGGGPGATAQTTATGATPVTVLPANPPTCTAKTLGVSRASNPGLAADCDTLLAIQSTLRVSGWINYDTPLWWDHSHPLNWSARSPLKHWRTVTLGGTPQRVIGLDFSDTRESVKVFNARTRQWAEVQPYTREWTLRGVIPTQLGNLTALETLDLGGSELTGSVPTQLGSLARLRTLDLSNNKLTGELPTELDDLDSLGRARLAGNAFTGCTPAELWRITSHDLDALGLPNCKPPLTYGAPSWTGIVDAPGEHAFFTNRGPAITYEGLRNDVIQVVIHKQDAGGAMRDAIYDDVEVGDDFEWREATDCWVRYVVERVLPDPTDMPLKVLAVKRYGYAYTGCSGQVSLTGSRTLTWVPPNIQSPDITVPVRHGPWLLVPPGSHVLEEETYHLPPPLAAAGVSPTCRTNCLDPIETNDITVAQQFPLWQEPELPAEWFFARGHIGSHASPVYGYRAAYSNAHGRTAVEILVGYVVDKPYQFPAYRGGGIISELRMIGGKAVWVRYSPAGPNHIDFASTIVDIHDDATGIGYIVFGYDPSLYGDNVDGTISIARSLLPSESDGHSDR